MFSAKQTTLLVSSTSQVSGSFLGRSWSQVSWSILARLLFLVYKFLGSSTELVGKLVKLFSFCAYSSKGKLKAEKSGIR